MLTVEVLLGVPLFFQFKELPTLLYYLATLTPESRIEISEMLTGICPEGCDFINILLNNENITAETMLKHKFID